MSVTDEIKNRLDIVNYIGQFVSLKKQGRNYAARCPFHNERTPSFVVFPDRQSWRCFGACSEGGDIFNFVMKREGLDFPSALRLLADQAGVELHERTPEQTSAEKQLDKLRGLLDESARFYHDKLVNLGKAAQARGYVKKRGLTDETVQEFHIGYSPNQWNALLEHLLRLGYKDEDCIEAGVAVRSESGRIYDRFRHRLMIPICDNRGKVIGFGARALDPDDNPKYLNSPQGSLFDKSHTLFGLHLARPSIRESETAVIVEGYMDAIQAHQAGFRNVVAQMGTALTEAQLKQISKYARRLILALDADKAGVAATMRGLEVIRESSDGGEQFFDPAGMMRQASRLDVEIRILTIPDAKDPDELIRDDPQAWLDAVNNATPVVDYVIGMGTQGITPQSTLADRERVARELLPLLVATENDLQRHMNIQQLALKLRLSEKALVEWAMAQRAKLMPRQKFAPTAAIPVTTSSPAENTPPTTETSGTLGSEEKAKAAGIAMERYCLAVLLRQPGWLSYINRRFRELATASRHDEDILGALSEHDFTDSDHRAIFATLIDAVDQYDLDPLDYLYDHLPYELHVLVSNLLMYPTETFEQKLSPLLVLEFARVRDEQNRLARNTGHAQELKGLERRALELRKTRLKRETLELQFLQQEVHESDRAAEVRYGYRVTLNSAAIRLIDTAMRDIRQHSHRQS